MTNLCLGSVFATCALSPQAGAVANAADNNVTPRCPLCIITGIPW